MRMETYIDRLEGVLESVDMIDLSHTLESGMPVWPTHARYGSVVHESYDNGDPSLCSMVMMSEHAGTHIDAPRHFVKGATPVDKLPLDAVVGRCVTIDASHLAPCRSYSLEELRAFEKKNGSIQKSDIVLYRFGWEDKYALQPNSAAFLKDWPGLSGEAGAWLKDVGVKAVGTDAMSLDAFGSDNPCHHILLGAGIPILENVCNLHRLPVHSYVMGFPNKFGGGSASPLRLVAFVGKE